ncbi:hypothetical protein BC830DRAFT_89192 [Chytriomyces sp. MP71]|nr:hypothetical protein BC830DRAFT_89192 [Chytriomyces sp. MP71]
MECTILRSFVFSRRERRFRISRSAPCKDCTVEVSLPIPPSFLVSGEWSSSGPSAEPPSFCSSFDLCRTRLAFFSSFSAVRFCGKLVSGSFASEAPPLSSDHSLASTCVFRAILVNRVIGWWPCYGWSVGCWGLCRPMKNKKKRKGLEGEQGPHCDDPISHSHVGNLWQ